jgi:hypothetical protein
MTATEPTTMPAIAPPLIPLEDVLEEGVGLGVDSGGFS